MDITTIIDLAKQGGRLSSDRQWELADALAQLTATQIAQVALNSGRNESTLYQYARAAQRWPEPDRVAGVSFSAHRVALSWHDPRSLLIELKHKYGSPTVQQVRQAMGLEGHPALSLIERGVKKLDRKVSAKALLHTISLLAKAYNELSGSTTGIDVPGVPLEDVDEDELADILDSNEPCVDCGSKAVFYSTYNDEPVCETCFLREGTNRQDAVVVATQVEEATTEKATTTKWQPRVRTSDIAGM